VSSHKIILKVNGQNYPLEIEASRTLVEVLRDELGLTGTKNSCDRGDCGSCTVLIDDKATKSCLVLAVEVEGKEITTVEGLSKDARLSAVQRAFIERGAIQCGFCTPAFVIAGEGLLRRNPNPTEQEAREAIEGILCRCTGYRQIIDAILHASLATKAQQADVPRS